MTKPKNPPRGLKIGYSAGFADGLLAGEKRLARALRTWINGREKEGRYGVLNLNGLQDWLTTRAKRRKK